MPELVEYRGVKMIEGWPARIVEAQSQTTYVIKGEEFSRFKYGSETDDWNAANHRSFKRILKFLFEPFVLFVANFFESVKSA